MKGLLSPLWGSGTSDIVPVPRARALGYILTPLSGLGVDNKGVETEDDIKTRKEFLRKIGCKL